jgi:hypothetical protein
LIWAVFGLIGHDGALGLARRCDGFVQGFACADVLGVELLLALAVLDRQLVLRLARFQRALGLLDRGLKQVLLDAVQRAALLDEVALLEQDGFKVALDPRPDVDAVDRLDASDEVDCLGNGPFVGNGDADGGRGGRFGVRGRDKRACQQGRPHRSSHSLSFAQDRQTLDRPEVGLCSS